MENYNDINYRCNACKKTDHSILKCPIIHFQPDSNLVKIRKKKLFV